MNREAIYKALFDKVKSVANFNTTSRKLKHWADVEASAQPALYQIQTGEQATQSKGSPAVWNMGAKLYIYANTANGNPSEIINPIIDSIEYALRPDYNGFQELGGLVSHCWIENIETSEGVLGDQEVAIISIGIKVANQLF